MSKKIVLFVSGLHGGGAEGVCVKIANQLAHQGYDIDLLVLNLADKKRLNEVSPKVRLRSLDVGSVKLSLNSLKNYIKTVKPQIFLTFSHELSVMCIAARKLLSKKYNFKVVSRNINFLSQSVFASNHLIYGYLYRWLLRNIYVYSDYFIAQSFAMKDDMVNVLNVDSERVKVINNPCLSVSLDDCRSQRVNEVVCIGRLEKQKRFDRAIISFYFCHKVNPAIHLSIYGEGSLKNRLVDLVNRLGLQDHVTFPGFVSDLSSVYKPGTITLLSSDYEGFPNVLVESISHGVPVVSVDCTSGPSEIVEGGVNGFLSYKTNVMALAESLRLGLEKQWDIREVKNSSDKFSIERVVHEYEEVLNKF
ncbi:glycosyltransferase [Vibrio sp. SCSIO 43140]|uniref:glycosyltransferase n=1 Tax=Vibrio sp. SCSIO 43140 TaxID=2819100 RepID=UPI002075AC95|nr:glycosyltransferase [Vibrio sp. SCSIO 43140]USD60241.1 glycosyltransferase [Vibrio sp. SCSIO 43140]